jgi:hypothetical protein
LEEANAKLRLAKDGMGAELKREKEEMTAERSNRELTVI